ncbi:MAG: restriction endonuclease subunit S [Bacteroidales bacterium]|nr:restriction endonuclease subunit S [Bacteroidales bacterium]
MDTKKLRQKILDLAIHGKLVPQDPNDEPASVLLERIRAEKERLIAEGKIKRSKKSATSDTSHYENVPFEVPEGWCWSCIENVCSKFTTGPFGSMVHKSDYVIDGGVPMVNPANMIGGNISYNKLMFVSELRAKDLQRYRLEPSDILLARRGDLTKCVVIKEEQKDWLCGTGSFVLHTILLLPTYFKLLYSSTYIQSILTSESVGATMDNLNQGLLSSIIIPIPPIEEQQRIVTTVGLWFSLIENLGVGYSELNQNISKAKSKILDLAIHGKLVPQDVNDEPASELLKRINPKAVASCDNPHYGNIPSSWVYTTMGSIFQHNTGKALNKSASTEGALLPYLTTSNVYWNTFDLSVVKEMRFKESEIEKCTIIKGDLLVCEGGDIGRAAIWNKDYSICIQNHLHRLRPKGDVVPLLYLYYLMYLKLTNKIEGKGIGLQGFSSGLLDKLEVPLPPYNEQIRIVDKIQETFNMLDSIAESLN